MRLPRLHLVRKRKIWLPTWRGWLLIVLAMFLIAWFIAANAYRFFGVTKPVENAELLVMEGWLADKRMQFVIDEFERGDSYRYVCTAGIQLGQGHYLSEHKTYPEMAAATLEMLGFPREKMIVGPGPDVMRDRTYASAKALRDHLESLGMLGPDAGEKRVRRLNVVTEGAHARRTWTVYRKVFEGVAEVGVYAINPMCFDPSDWWKSSGGVKQIIMETVSLGFEWLEGDRE